MSRRGNTIFLHELLGKVLAALKLCTGLGGTNHLQVGQGILHIVGDASHQRVFAAHDEHVDVVILAEVGHLPEVERFQCHIGAVLSCAGIAGGNEQLIECGALCQFPGQRTFASAGAQQQYVEFVVHESLVFYWS